VLSGGKVRVEIYNSNPKIRIDAAKESAYVPNLVPLKLRLTTGERTCEGL